MKLKSANFTFIKGPSLGEEIADIIFKKIECGEIKEKDILPTEQELVNKFQVSRTVIREALARLRYDDIVSSKKGVGTIVNSIEERKTFRLRENNKSDKSKRIYLYEFRFILEGEAAALAAIRRKKEHVELLSNYIEEMKYAIDHQLQGVVPDMKFHQSIAEASGNSYIRDFMNFLYRKVKLLIESARNKSNLQHQLAQEVLDEHIGIFKAINSKSPVKARKAVHYHILNGAHRQNLEIFKGFKGIN